MSEPGSPGPAERATVAGGPLLTLELLDRIPGVVHAFELRGGDIGTVLPGPATRLQQVHGAAVHRIDGALSPDSPYLEEDPLRRPPGDALITREPGRTVAVAVADCLPVLIADRDATAVAAVHAGWRGLVAGVLSETVRNLESAYGIFPERLSVAIGPSIGACCYVVGEDVVRAFARVGLAEVAFPRPPGVENLPVACDLEAAAREQIRRAGIDEGEVASTEICTACEPERAWSYRVDGDRAGRMLGGIALESR